MWIRVLPVLLTMYTNTAYSQICFRINQQPPLYLGKTLDINIQYGIDEGGDNYGKKNSLTDFLSVDSTLSMQTAKGLAAGTIFFTCENKANKLVSLNGFWMFMTGDSPEDRLAILKAIKVQFLNCLDLEKLDLSTGGQYTISKAGYNETFTLVPRIRPGGIDANYWSFYYSVK